VSYGVSGSEFEAVGECLCGLLELILVEEAGGC